MSERRLEQGIAEAVAELHGQWYGRGPSSAVAYVTDGLVAVVLEETFTHAEMGLVERGEADGIREIRRRWQSAAAEDLKEIVTRATGRQVRSFISDTDLHEQIAIEVFVLGGELEDMTQFEGRQVRSDSTEP